MKWLSKAVGAGEPGEHNPAGSSGGGFHHGGVAALEATGKY